MKKKFETNEKKPKEIKYLLTIKRIDGLLNQQRLKEKIKIILRFVHPFYCNWKAWQNFFTKVISQEIGKIKKKEAKDYVARPFYIPGRDMCQETDRLLHNVTGGSLDSVSLRPFEVRVDKTSRCPVFTDVTYCHLCANQSLIGC